MVIFYYFKYYFLYLLFSHFYRRDARSPRQKINTTEASMGVSGSVRWYCPNRDCKWSFVAAIPVNDEHLRQADREARRRSEAAMRATRIEVLHGREVPLVVRARSERTIIKYPPPSNKTKPANVPSPKKEALLDPLGASDMAVLTAGLALALSSFLLVYLVWPRRKMELARREQLETAEQNWKRPVVTIRLYDEGQSSRTLVGRALGDRKHLPGPM